MLILPIVLVLAAIVYSWIQLVSSGNVLFRQTRIGRSGKPFTIYKFRSMKSQAATQVHEAHVRQLIKSDLPFTKLDSNGDSRLIRGGCLIRAAGLDELPQFINVLRGEMSLVGPRPCLPVEYELFKDDQRNRFAAQPGLTGLWQVRRSASATFRDMIRMDDEYVSQLSPILDLQIVLKTPWALVRQMRECARSKALHSAKRRSAIQPQYPSYALSMSSTQKISD